METIVLRQFDDLADARHAVQQLIEAGIPRDAIDIFGATMRERAAAAGASGQPAHHDLNVERQGSFADKAPHYHDRNVERQGSFADKAPHYHDRNVERQGSFADKAPHYHDRNVERQGSFADTAATSGGDETLKAALLGAGLTEHEAIDAAAQLRSGATLVVAHVQDSQAEQAAQILG